MQKERTHLLTVFTPAYNRAHTIARTYKSLCRQTCKDFEWLVIDDGSTDNTRELIEEWTSENIIPIRYIYQENQGMHGAHNTAYKNITTELNTCIDSDDWMPEDAVETIKTVWRKYGSKDVSGLVGLDCFENGDVVGSEFPQNLTCVKVGEFYQAGGTGDKKLVYRTDLIKETPEYPIFKGEKYFSLAYRYLILEQEYSMISINKPLAIVEYQADGSSYNMFKQYWNNAEGWKFYRLFEMGISKSIKRRIKLHIHYVSSCIISRDANCIKNSPNKFLTFVLSPIGAALYLYIRYKVKNNKSMKFIS